MIKVKREMFREIDFELVDGTLLYAMEWNGEQYIVKEDGREVSYTPIQKPIMFDENGEPYQWETIGFEKF